MSDDTTSSHVDSMVRSLVEMQSDSGSKATPVATTDVDDVIKSQLTENTGRHLLDSGSAYGRHWEENQDNPPWNDCEWDVSAYKPDDGYVTHNVYDFMHRAFGRDELAVALEVALYAFGRSGDRKRDSWLTTMKDFAGALVEDPLDEDILSDFGLPDKAIDDVLGYSHDVRFNTDTGVGLSDNTYNSEFHSLSQCIQTTALGGLHAEYVAVQVHGGCDIRGGYTAPRVYSTGYYSWRPMELQFTCTDCEYHDAESCVVRDNELLWIEQIDPEQIDEFVKAQYPDHYSESELQPISANIIEELHEQSHIDGGILHKCQRGLGVVEIR